MLRKYIQNTLLFIAGIIIIFYILFIRLIHQRHDFILSSLSTSFFATYMCLFFIGLHFILLLLTLYAIIKTTKNNTNKFFNMFATFFAQINTFVIKSIVYVYKQSVVFILKKQHFAVDMAYVFFNLQPYYFFVVIIFYILPRVIIIVCFLIDVYCYETIHYFYKSLALFLLPLFANTYQNILKEHYKEMRSYYEQFFDIMTDISGEFSYFSRPGITSDIPIEELISYHYMYTISILRTIPAFISIKAKWDSYIIIVYHLFFLFTWSYIFICYI